MPIDLALAELLRSIGYLIASHVMARASLSVGTGRNEEPLTADIADLLSLLDPYSEFLQVRGSKSRLGIGVLDLSKAAESRNGADFVIVLRGSSGRPRSQIRKFVFVQAKRQVWGLPKYAASGNHVVKAKSMAAKAGLQDSFFAYYHSNDVAPLVGAPWSARPSFVYASPVAHGNQHFFANGTLGPKVPEGFLETSPYRRHLLGASATRALPPGFEWGIGILEASYFVNAAGTTMNASLPTVQHVLAHGVSFGAFLVDLAECRKGTPRTDAALRALLLALLLRASDNDDPDAFNPGFAVLLEFASGGSEDDDDIPEPEPWPLEIMRAALG